MGDVCVRLGAVGNSALTNMSSTQRRIVAKDDGTKWRTHPANSIPSLWKHGSDFTARGVKEGKKIVLESQSLTRARRANTVTYG